MLKSVGLGRHIKVLAAFLMVLPASLVGPAGAQTGRPVTIVVGFAAGTAPDSLARILAAGLEKTLKRSVIVENVAGAGGQIGASRVARSAGDGVTFLLGELGAMAIAPYAFASLPYDATKDFAAVSEVARSNFVLAVPAQEGAGSIKAFVERGKGKSVLFATFGAASPGHVAAELFGQVGGFKVEPVHYRGVSEAITDLGANRTAGSFLSVPLAAAQIKAGKIKGIAQTGAGRAAMLRDVPTVIEAGFPALEISAWFVLLAPASTPQAMIDQVSAAAIAAVKDPASAERLTGAGFEVTGTTASDARAMIEKEQARWKDVIQKAGIRIVN